MAHDILIVDDEADIRVLTSGILQDEGYQTREAAGSADALSAVEARRPSLVLLDIWLQGSEMDGLGILKVLKRDHSAIPVLIMSGHGNIETAVTAIKDGGQAISKSVLMPPWGGVLSDEEIHGLVGYLRKLCQCRHGGA